LSFCGWVYKAKTQRDLNMKLLAVVLDGDVEATRSLLKRGADPNIRNEPQQPLSRWQQIQYVFHKDSQTAQDQNATLLEMAMYSDGYDTSEPVNVALIKTLLEAGARPNDYSDGDRTPLITAVRYDSPQTVRILLDHGARVDVLDNDDNTPLMCCIQLPRRAEDTDIMKLLIAQGADVNHRNKAGNTALSLARKDEDKQSIRLLEAAGAKR